LLLLVGHGVFHVNVFRIRLLNVPCNLALVKEIDHDVAKGFDVVTAAVLSTEVGVQRLILNCADKAFFLLE